MSQTMLVKTNACHTRRGQVKAGSSNVGRARSGQGRDKAAAYVTNIKRKDRPRRVPGVLLSLTNFLFWRSCRQSLEIAQRTGNHRYPNKCLATPGNITKKVDKKKDDPTINSNLKSEKMVSSKKTKFPLKVQVTVMIYTQELLSHGDLYLELEELWDTIIVILN